MKKIFLVVLCFVFIFGSSGCGQKEVASAQIFRDDARVGGSLSFVYDQKERTLFIGGKDEVVQFSQTDEVKNLNAGCRVGLKVVAPDEVDEVDDATLEMNGVNYSSDDFLEKVNGQKQRFFNIYPTFSKNDNKVEFVLKWNGKVKKQTYKIVVENGTKFMDAEGNVS